MGNEDTTKRHRALASILLVSEASKELELGKRCSEQLGVYFKHCDVDGVTGAAAKWRPFALVVNERISNADRRRVERTAQECRATMVLLQGDPDDPEVERSLLSRLQAMLTNDIAWAQ
jgi:hypothetical protein